MLYSKLRRIRKYLSLEKTKLLCSTFINSQFNYAPMMWMILRIKQYLKERRKSYFCVTPMKMLKSAVTKKVIVCFSNLGEENF